MGGLLASIWLFDVWLFVDLWICLVGHLGCRGIIVMCYGHFQVGSVGILTFPMQIIRSGQNTITLFLAPCLGQFPKPLFPALRS